MQILILVLGLSYVSGQILEKSSEPPAEYSFEYHVNNPETGDIKSQNEVRQGDVVSGHYGLVEPDGSVRTVEYTADDQNGFRAVVHKSGGPAGVNELPKSLLPAAGSETPEYSTDNPFSPEQEPSFDISAFSSTTTKEPETSKSVVSVTPKSTVSVTPKSALVTPSTLIPPLANPYLYPYYKYAAAAHPWTLYNLYKTHPAYRYSLLHPAHPANPLSPLHPANPLLTPYSALNPLLNPLYHV